MDTTSYIEIQGSILKLRDNAKLLRQKEPILQKLYRKIVLPSMRRKLALNFEKEKANNKAKL